MTPCICFNKSNKISTITFICSHIQFKTLIFFSTFHHLWSCISTYYSKVHSFLKSLQLTQFDDSFTKLFKLTSADISWKVWWKYAPPSLVNWRLREHCFKNEWTLITYFQITPYTKVYTFPTITTRFSVTGPLTFKSNQNYECDFKKYFTQLCSACYCCRKQQAG